MSRLTQLRQRIKTVTTLQKTTHAMRLTSMSTHSRLLKKKELLETYKNEIERILNCCSPKVTFEEKKDLTRHLVITVGSQKGLCGAFNTRLMHLYEKDYHLKKNHLHDLICVGRKPVEYLAQRKVTPHDSYDLFSSANFVDIAHELSNIILGNGGNSSYTHVTIYSNHPHTFFVQNSKKIEIAVPKKIGAIRVNPEATHTYEQPQSKLLVHAQNMYMKACIEDLLFKSLIAEQAARFVSMDSSTRNAEKFIELMQRDYNKLRQALITRELTDLAGGLL